MNGDAGVQRRPGSPRASSARRGWRRRPRSRPAGPRRARAARSTKPSGPAIATSASAIGVLPTTASSGAGSIGSQEDLQRAAGQARVDHHLRAGRVRERARRRRAAPAAARVSPSAQGVRAPPTAPTSSAHWPPTKPSIEPSARITASSPGRAEDGSWARTTVACTNGTRADGQLGDPGRHPRDSSTPASTTSDCGSDRRRGVAAAWRPTPGTGSAACRRAGRRTA